MNTNNIEQISGWIQNTGMQLLDVHTGESVCFVIKRGDVNTLRTLPQIFPQYMIVSILPEQSDLYNYLFIKKAC